MNNTLYRNLEELNETRPFDIFEPDRLKNWQATFYPKSYLCPVATEEDGTLVPCEDFDMTGMIIDF